MKKLSNCIDEFLDHLSIDNRKIAQAAFNIQQYKNAVLNIWKNQDAANLILSKTNAFYIRKDYTKKLKRSVSVSEGNSNSLDGEVVCEIYLEDSLVLSELNAKREILELALKSCGLTFAELKLIHSKGSMRIRHPFAE